MSFVPRLACLQQIVVHFGPLRLALLSGLSVIICSHEFTSLCGYRHSAFCIPSGPTFLFPVRPAPYQVGDHFPSNGLDATLLAGLCFLSFKGHGFLIVAASTATAAGLADLPIKVMGRWLKNCYQLYAAPRIANISLYPVGDTSA